MANKDIIIGIRIPLIIAIVTILSSWALPEISKKLPPYAPYIGIGTAAIFGVIAISMSVVINKQASKSKIEISEDAGSSIRIGVAGRVHLEGNEKIGSGALLQVDSVDSFVARNNKIHE